jgi:hypothetical protein
MYGEGHHLTNHIFKNTLVSDNVLHVVGVCSNPVRYHSRYRIARQWIHHMAHTPNVKLHIVEAAFNQRQHELEDVCIEHGVEFIPLRTLTEYWIKESMLNIGMRHACVKYNAKYLAWIDMDVFFEDPEWAQEALHQLQHFDVIQPWSDCMDMGAHGNVLQHFKSFGLQHQRRVPKQKHPSQTSYQYAHTGFAWCCTRRFFENAQGLMDFPPLGSSDHHMAFAMISEVMDTVHGKMKESFKRRAREWQARAVQVTKNEVGFSMGTIKHMFHGPKKRRYYRERWELLFDYDPDVNMMRDDQGLCYIVGLPKLEQDIRLYNRSRFEDSIEEN